MGRIMDSYWLYRVKRRAEKSGRPRDMVDEAL